MAMRNLIFVSGVPGSACSAVSHQIVKHLSSIGLDPRWEPFFQNRGLNEYFNSILYRTNCDLRTLFTSFATYLAMITEERIKPHLRRRQPVVCEYYTPEIWAYARALRLDDALIDSLLGTLPKPDVVFLATGEVATCYETVSAERNLYLWESGLLTLYGADYSRAFSDFYRGAISSQRQRSEFINFQEGVMQLMRTWRGGGEMLETSGAEEAQRHAGRLWPRPDACGRDTQGNRGRS